MGSHAGRAASELSMQKALSQLHLSITCLFQINDNLDAVLYKEAWLKILKYIKMNKMCLHLNQDGVS